MNHAVPIFGGHGRERAVAGDAGVGDDAVVGAVCFYVGQKCLLSSLSVADVKGKRACFPAGLSDQPERFVKRGRRFGPVHYNTKAVAGQLQSNGAADAAGGAGNKNGKVSRRSHHCAKVVRTNS